MHANRPDLLENGVLILHDNARPHLDKDVCELLDGYSWEVLPHPPYSPDMSCCIPKARVGWERRMRSTLTEREGLSALENLRIEIQVHSNSR